VSEQHLHALAVELPEHRREMSLFAVNTGCRDSEICGLRWDWEVDVPALGTSVFIVPGTRVKNGADRLVVLNTLAAAVMCSNRGERPELVVLRGALRDGSRKLPQARP
jgi:integrase